MFSPGDVITHFKRWNRRAMTDKPGPYVEGPRGFCHPNKVIGSVDGMTMSLVLAVDLRFGEVLVINGTSLGWIDPHDMSKVLDV